MSFTINTDNQYMYLTRGDTLSITIRDNTTGLPFVFGATDTVKLTVRKSIYDDTFIFQKVCTPDVDGHISIDIANTDTKDQNYGVYYYDIQWSKLDGYVNTLIPKTGNTCDLPQFNICKEVTT